jgi:hypothetical protein
MLITPRHSAGLGALKPFVPFPFADVACIFLKPAISRFAAGIDALFVDTFRAHHSSAALNFTPALKLEQIVNEFIQAACDMKSETLGIRR